MPVSDYGCVLASPGSFGVAQYTDLIDLIERVESDFLFTDIIDAYNDGSHPLLRYQDSVLELTDSAGEQFYGAMLDIIRRFEKMYPHAVATGFSLPSCSTLMVSGTRLHHRGVLPIELLERIFSLCTKAEQFLARLVCRDWCFAASRYTHSAIVFRMNTDWQYWVNTPDGKRDAELYAFACECVVLYITYKWGFPLWVVSVSYFDWPSTPGPFFYNAFPNVRNVVFHGKTCRLRNYPVLRFPQILPPSVQSLRIVRCSLRGHSVEYMLPMCRDIQTIALHSVHYGHVVAPLARSFVLDDACAWLSRHGIVPTSPAGALEAAPSSICRLALHFPDDPVPIKSTASDARGTPPLLLQLFPDPPQNAEPRYFLWDDKVFPVRLRTSMIDDLEICLTPNLVYVLPHVVRCIGNNLTVLRITFPTTMRLRATSSFCLAGLSMLTRLHVEVNTQDLRHVLHGCASWSSDMRGSSDSAFDLVLLHVSSLAVQLEEALRSGSFYSVLCGTDLNSHRPLVGRFQLRIRSLIPFSDIGPVEMGVSEILEGMRASDDVYAAIGDAEWLH